MRCFRRAGGNYRQAWVVGGGCEVGQFAWTGARGFRARAANGWAASHGEPRGREAGALEARGGRGGELAGRKRLQRDSGNAGSGDFGRHGMGIGAGAGEAWGNGNRAGRRDRVRDEEGWSDGCGLRYHCGVGVAGGPSAWAGQR